MRPDVIQVIQDCSAGSDEQRLSFPQVVAMLVQAGVERYHADLRRAEKTYHLPDGASHVIAVKRIAAVPAEAFSAQGVETAVRAIQAGAIGYQAFCARIMEAGCVGYLVSLAGRRAVYYGRTGETHVERFPTVAS